MKSNLNQEKLNKSLGLFLEAMRKYVLIVMRKAHGKRWDQEYYSLLGESQQRMWDENTRQDPAKDPQLMIDFGNLKFFALRKKDLLREDFGRTVNKLPTQFDDIRDARNMTYHFDDWNDEVAEGAYINMIKIARKLGMTDLEDSLTRIRDDDNTAAAAVATPDTSAGLPAWFNNVTPHYDIRQGNLDESVFAADLAEVALGSGREVYLNHTLFFQKTYFTAGLRNVAQRVIKGLNGDEEGENRVISLQTGFGGGKTHMLIAMYHLAFGGKRLAGLPALQELTQGGVAPDFDRANIAVFTNTTNDPVQGREADGLTIRTLWGELAYQLGGTEAYRLIEENDRHRSAPKGLFKKILAEYGPSLILLDELADYCVAAAAVKVGKSTLSDQTISFMQELSQAVAATPGCVLIMTLPGSAAEVANSPEAASILSSLKSRVGRVGADTQPVADDEIFDVIRYRLFENLGNEDVRKEIVTGYMEMYEELKSELPSSVTNPEFREMMEKAYPFHPQLINVFRKRWAGHPDFQRTRGVLRLLASIVSDLYQRRGNLSGVHTLIHPTHVALENLDTVKGEIKKLYGNGYDAVITSDVSGTDSNAYAIDQERPEFRSHRLAQGIAVSVLLHSFGEEGGNRGLTIKELKLSALAPSAFDHHMVNTAMQELESKAYYLYHSDIGIAERRYWFHTKPNLNILVNKTKAQVQDDQVETEIIQQLTSARDQVRSFKVSIAPAADIPEMKSLTLVILHPSKNVNSNKAVTKEIAELATTKGNADRLYRNTILFLSLSSVARGKLYSDVRDYLACQRIMSEYETQLDTDQMKEMKRRKADALQHTQESLVAGYNNVHKYRAKDGLDTLAIRQFAPTIQRQVDEHIYATLKTEDWLLESVGTNTLARNNLMPRDGAPVRIRDVYEAFLRYDDKPMISGAQAIGETVRRYVLSGDFAMAVGNEEDYTEAYFRQSVPNLNIEDETQWLISPDDYRKWKSEQEAEGAVVGRAMDDTGATPDTDDRPDAESGPEAQPLRSIVISGTVDPANYHQLFTSFVRPLANNRVQIEVKITGHTTDADPLTRSSRQYKIAKESAVQLGLGFEEVE